MSSKKNNIKLTPMLQQYMDIKAQYPDALLLFRMGDFYETFFDDAKILADVANVTLTTRDKRSEHPVPLSGVPYHAIQTYLSKLLNAGYTVAICEQVEDPSQAKGLVKREVVEIISPGTDSTGEYIDSKSSNYCLAFHSGNNGQSGWAILDASTGELRCGTEQISLISLCERFNIREAIIAETIDLDHLQQLRHSLPSVVINLVNASWFYPSFAHTTLCEHFNVLSLDPFDLEGDANTLAVSTAGAVLKYFESLSMSKPNHITTISHSSTSDKLLLDEETLRNLEIFKTFRGEKGEGTVIHHIDHTSTRMGRRLLEQRLAEPLTDIVELTNWHSLVDQCKTSTAKINDTKPFLTQIGDIQMLTAHVVSNKIGPAKLRSLGQSLAAASDFYRALPSTIANSITELSKATEFPNINDITKDILNTISEDSPTHIKSGFYIKVGVNSELDSYREIISSTKTFLATLQQGLRDKTGIPTLKVGFNKVFGYYIEVTKKHLEKVPDHFEQKQTLVNACRFHTPELNDAEQKINDAEYQLSAIEIQIFNALISKVAKSAESLLAVAEIVATADLVISFAELSEKNSWCKPVCDDSTAIDISKGRHPVVEQLIDTGFIPNDTLINTDDNQVMLLTGPNMGGKSTYLRQVALITLLAQIGSHVPADSAHIGITDRIFTRVGASDNVARGQSTFFSEMAESARILHLMTHRSLVILDEVGRGTSTYDGLSLAWAITEYLQSSSGPKPRTIFATHYHELTSLENNLSGLFNMRMDVKEWEGKIIFLHSIKPGCSDKSYGIHVARLAGIPEPVLNRATQILDNLALENERSISESDFNESGFSIAADSIGARHDQLSLFTDQERSALDDLKELDLNKISPVDAFMWLAKLKKQLAK